MSQVKVLFFASDAASADPRDHAPRLLQDVAARSLRDKVPAGVLEFDYRWAARPDDLLQALNETRPQVVHFSGHGTEDGLELMGDDGLPLPVSNATLVRLFKLFGGGIRLVVLDACESLGLATEVAAHVGCAIGHPGAYPDDAAVVFAAAFYRAIAFRHSVQAAYEQARIALEMEGFADGECPVLVAAPGADASRVVLVHDAGGGAPREPHDEPARREIRQDVRVDGHGNVVNVAAGDMHVATPPRVRSAAPAVSYVSVTVPAAQAGIPACKPPNARKLFGREAAIDRLVSRLTAGGEDGWVQGVYGLPGAGKTDLLRAVGCARTVVRHFGGGVLYAELGQQANALEILRGWCTALILELPQSTVAEDFSARIRTHLAQNRALLVVDDVWESSMEAARQLADCRAPGCALLLSTRSPDIAGAFCGAAGAERLEMLEDVPAVDLLAEHAPNAVQRDRDGAEELAKNLGRLPLALKLAGHLAQRDDSPEPCRALLGNWRVRLKEMKGYERRPGLESSDLSLDAIISLSYDAMPDDETRAAAALLSVLGPAPLDFNRRAIDSAWSTISLLSPSYDPARADDWLRAFVSSGLLERNPERQRYSLHQTVHAFLEERCQARTISAP
ncbi:MAG TPA: NB-ARC domain-containing protein [Longimicrobium sp.]|nr:NB-ARC domain-containing protein [Longimicrobium sp.]